MKQNNDNLDNRIETKRNRTERKRTEQNRTEEDNGTEQKRAEAQKRTKQNDKASRAKRTVTTAPARERMSGWQLRT